MSKNTQKNTILTDFKVIGTESKAITHTVDDEEVTEVMVSKLLVIHEGHEFGVKQGLDVEQRRKFHQEPKLIIGKRVSVGGFGESELYLNKIYDLE